MMASRKCAVETCVWKRNKYFGSQYYFRMKAYYAFTLEGDYATAKDCLRELMRIDLVDFPHKPEWQYMDLANSHLGLAASLSRCVRPL